MRISDWSSDVCSSDLAADQGQALVEGVDYRPGRARRSRGARGESPSGERPENAVQLSEQGALWHRLGLDGCRRSLLFGGSPIYARSAAVRPAAGREPAGPDQARQHAQRRSEEHTSELQSLMRTSYAVFCLKKKNSNTNHPYTHL